MNKVDILVPEKAILIAKEIIDEALPFLDKTNVLAIFGVGSFWFPRKKHNPRDIDLVVCAQNDIKFIEEDRSKIAQPLRSMFNLYVETHMFTPYTSAVRYGPEKARFMLKENFCLFGQLPDWL